MQKPDQRGQIQSDRVSDRKKNDRGNCFSRVILDAQKHLREGSAVERSAQAASIGIFSLLFVPFWLVQLPFSIIGSLWSSHRLGALVTTAVLLSITYAITLYLPSLIQFLHSF